MGRKCTQTYIEVDPCAPSATSLVDVVDNNIDYSKTNIDRQNIDEFMLKCTEGKGMHPGKDSLAWRESLTQIITVRIRTKEEGDKNIQLKVNKNIKDSVLSIFKKIYDTVPEYYFVKVKGEKSSYYGYQTSGGYIQDLRREDSKGSRHCYGLALDLNGDHNPYLELTADNCYKGGTFNCQSGEKEIIHMRDKNHPVVKIFEEHGWGWGGSYKDYMHFSIDGH